MPEPRLKKHKWYLVFRWLIVFTIIDFFVLLVLAFLEFPASVVILILAIPLFFSGLVMIYSTSTLFIFNFDYSALGRLERTPFPDEPVILVEKYRWGRIGFYWNHYPLFNWYVFPSGLGVQICGIGKAFIPVEYFKSLIKDDGLVLFATHYQLEHKSPELRDPIFLPDKRVFTAVQKIFNDYKNRSH